MTDRKIADYRGFEIALREPSWEFLVIGEDFTTADRYGSRNFGSFEAAKTAIDLHHTNEGKAEAKTVKVALKCFDHLGTPVTFTGLNRASGKAKVEGRPNDNKGLYEGTLYPLVGWVGEAARRLAVIQEEARELSTKLHPLGVRVGASYHSQIAAERYAGAVKKIQDELAEAEAKAREIGQ